MENETTTANLVAAIAERDRRIAALDDVVRAAVDTREALAVPGVADLIAMLAKTDDVYVNDAPMSDQQRASLATLAKIGSNQ